MVLGVCVYDLDWQQSLRADDSPLLIMSTFHQTVLDSVIRTRSTVRAQFAGMRLGGQGQSRHDDVLSSGHT